MSRLPPLNTLRSFEVAGRHLNFSRAAEELNVTQSAVSHQMRLLEERLGVRLFKRANNGLVLTDAGQRLLPAVRDSFARLEKVVAEIDAETRETPVRVALRPYFAVKWLAPRLGRFWQRHPAVELWLNHTIERVAFVDGDVDLAIEWSTGERADVGADRLVGGGLTPVFSPALADGREALSAPADLGRHTLLHEESHHNWRAWLGLAGHLDLAPAHDLVIDDTNVRLQAAIDGQGVALGCRALIADDLAAGRLVAPFPTTLGDFAYYVVCPDSTMAKPAVRAFRDWLLDEANAAA